MVSKKKSNVYYLIHTLSDKEKLTVKRALNRDRASQLVYLLDLYDTQDDFQIIRHEWDSRFPKTKISASNNRLFSKILWYLTMSEKKHFQTFNRSCISFLVKKGLLGLALKEIKKGKRYAAKFEEFTLELSLIQDEREILLEYFLHDNKLTQIEHLYQLEIEIENIIGNLSFVNKCFSLLRMGTELSREESLFLENQDNCLSVKAQLVFNRIGIMRAREKGDIRGFIEQMKLAEALLDSNSHLFKCEEINFVYQKIISALPIMYLETRDFEKAKIYLNKLEIAHQENRDIKALGRFWVVQLYYLEVSGQHDKLKSLLNTISGLFVGYETRFDPKTRINLMTGVAIVYFKLGMFIDSGFWADQLFKLSSLHYLPHFIVFGKIFYLITLFHTEQAFPDSPLRRAKYFLKKNNKSNAYTDFVFSILDRLNAEPNPHKVFSNIEFPNQKAGHFEQMTCYFDLEVWVKSFLTSTPMMTLESKEHHQ